MTCSTLNNSTEEIRTWWCSLSRRQFCILAFRSRLLGLLALLLQLGRPKPQAGKDIMIWYQSFFRNIQHGDLNLRENSKRRRMPRSRPELLSHEILHLKEPLVDSVAFYHFGTISSLLSRGGKNHPAA